MKVATHLCTGVLFMTLMGICKAQSEKKSGLYNITVISIGNCPDGGTNDIVFKTTISKISKDSLCYSGWISLPYGLTNQMQEHWEISSLGSTGGWKTNFLTFRNKHACADTKRLFPQWFKVLEVAKLNDTSCPIPKGNYSFTCLDLSNLQFEKSSIMLYGTYRVTINYFLNKRKIGCTMYKGIVQPRVNETGTTGVSTSSLVSEDFPSIGRGASFHPLNKFDIFGFDKIINNK
ncbi:uncharacterized protein LOC124358618 [Homalodisca vitripennis]|uniref:uncharacterized protein LOC124358618 n=1 Tax=Homalodisca vitripennis TaxID=197043 RepID=UPI001EEB583E|nr:uncharacterized protein LOC124358618 [Homalodisca vitripennis]